MTDWTARARSKVMEMGIDPDFGSGPEWVRSHAALAAEAFQAGERKAMTSAWDRENNWASRNVWLDPAKVSCLPLTDAGEPGVIMRDYHAA